MSAHDRQYCGWSNSRGRDDGGDDYASHRRRAYNSGQSANRGWERSSAPNDETEAALPQKAPTPLPKEANARKPPSRRYGDDDWRASYKPNYVGAGDDGNDDRRASRQNNNNNDDMYTRARPAQQQQYVANQDDDDDDEEETGEDFLDQLTLSPRGQHIVMKKPGEPSYGNTKIVVEDLQLFMEGNQIEDLQWANEKKASSARAKPNGVYANANAKPKGKGK